MIIDRSVQVASRSRSFWLLVVATLLALLLTPPMQAGDPPTHKYQLPLQFVRNAGQWPAYVRYMMLPAENRVVFLDDGVMFQVRKEKHTTAEIPLEVATNIQADDDSEQYDYVIMRFVDPSQNMRLEEINASETKMNFYLGDSSTWREDVGCSRGIVYRNAWDGVDLHFSTDGSSMRQVITHATGSSESPQFSFEGDDDVVERLQAALHWRGGRDAGQTSVLAGDSLRFRIPDRIPTDSTYYWTEYATFFTTPSGATNGFSHSGVDASSRLTLIGGTYSSNLPTTVNAYQRESNIGMGSPNNFVRYFGRIRCDGITPDYLSYYGSSQRSIYMYGDLNYYGGRNIVQNKVFMRMGIVMDNIVDTSARYRYYPPTPDALENKYPISFLPAFSLLSRFDSSGYLVYSSAVRARK